MDSSLRVPTGVEELDRLLGGLYIGDNVVWLDDAGSLAWIFCLNFIRASLEDQRPLIYVSFDRSPTNLLEKLRPLAPGPQLTVLDCFTHGKGQGNEVFRQFYQTQDHDPSCRVAPVEEPWDPARVMEAIYGLHAKLEGEVRFVFESLGGMQDLWGGEEHVLGFYSRSCPRLYELRTNAYWIMEKQAHSPRLRAHVSQIAQVVIDLSVKRGTTSLTILKAENRAPETLRQSQVYWVKDLEVGFGGGQRTGSGLDLGLRLRELRSRKGLSQTELARLVGVTPSTISQVESNLIYPSLPALLKMAEVLSVEISSFFKEGEDQARRVIFPAGQAQPVKITDLPPEVLSAHLLTSADFTSRGEPYLLEIGPKQEMGSHFFSHKGEEMGYLLAGRLSLRLGKATYTLRAGDLIYLTNDTPSQWVNPGRSPARLLWVKIK